jgi:hypothetical protein
MHLAAVQGHIVVVVVVGVVLVGTVKKVFICCHHIRMGLFVMVVMMMMVDGRTMAKQLLGSRFTFGWTGRSRLLLAMSKWHLLNKRGKMVLFFPCDVIDMTHIMWSASSSSPFPRIIIVPIGGATDIPKGGQCVPPNAGFGIIFSN